MKYFCPATRLIDAEACEAYLSHWYRSVQSATVAIWARFAGSAFVESRRLDWSSPAT